MARRRCASPSGTIRSTSPRCGRDRADIHLRGGVLTYDGHIQSAGVEEGAWLHGRSGTDRPRFVAQTGLEITGKERPLGDAALDLALAVADRQQRIRR